MSALDEYQRLLTQYLDDRGGVRYQVWHDCRDDVAALDGVLQRWLDESPDSHPASFASAAHRLGYWLNLYNALVIREVLRRWPLTSVRDVRPTLLSKVAPLKGFFLDLRFDVAGRSMNLAAIENKVIRSQFKDARIHFALNCGSAACPVLRRSVFDGEVLEAQLNDATRAFVAQRKNVRVDAETRTVWLSKIFKWYERDFEKHAVMEGWGEGVLAFVRSFADGELGVELEAAERSRYRVRFEDYDWSVNQS